MAPHRPLALVALALLLSRGALAWQTPLPGTPGVSRPFGVAVDTAGDVVVAGRAVVAAGNDDAVLAKLSGVDGTLRWQHTFAGTAAASDLLRAVTTDATRSVIAGGQLLNTGTAGDLLVTCYDAAGTQGWRVELDGGGADEDDAQAVAVDTVGAVLVAAQMTPQGTTRVRFTVLKLAAADGATAWRTELPGEPGTARAIALDGDTVYAAGDVAGKIAVVKLAAASGAPVWQQTNLTGSADGAHVGRAVAVGGGRVVVAGRVTNLSTGPDFAVVALDATTGDEAWRYVLDGTATGTADTDDAFTVAVDADGNVVAAGSLGNVGTDADGVIVKLAGATGAELWRRTVSGNAANDDLVQAIALDAAGDVLVTGTIRRSGTRADVLVAKLAGATGVPIWSENVNGSENGNDAGVAVAATGDGHLVAAARVRNGAAVGSIALFKRSGATGGNFPCGDGTTNEGEACDDANAIAGDGCRANCTHEACGDGILDPQESCDDGGVADGDCCSATCRTIEQDDTACDDGNGCTVGDRCVQGACVSTSSLVCEPTDPCDRPSCDAGSGICSHARSAEGSLCDDGNVCTVLDQCVGDICAGAGAPFCQDDDPCTADACLPSVGCDYQLLGGFAALTCLFERATIVEGCPGGVPHPIASRLGRARRLATAASTAERTPKVRRALGHARTALKQATRLVEKRRGLLEPACVTALQQALADMLSRTEGLRAPLLH